MSSTRGGRLASSVKGDDQQHQHDKPRPPHKQRATSLSGFLSKLLPSNRPEQGGTTRLPEDLRGDGDSGYLDLGMDPNELRDWNPPRERESAAPGGQRRSQGQDRIASASVTATSAAATSFDRKAISSGSHRKRRLDPNLPPPDLRIYDDLSRFPAQLTSPQTQTAPALSEGLSAPPASHYRRNSSASFSGNEISALLRSKEDTRRRRRSLKESGDWLGVQGADPYSGEIPVLTPTETISSDTTPPSTKTRLNGLNRKKKVAKIAYEQARLEEEAERERAVLAKDRQRLEKLERVKAELRRQEEVLAGGRVTWSQHRRQWSSAAEPNLSPIAQSLSSLRIVDTSSDEKPAVVATNAPNAAAAGITVPNFSRPSGSQVIGVASSSTRPSIEIGNPGIGSPKNVEATTTPNAKHSRLRIQSTDTVVVRRQNAVSPLSPSNDNDCTLHPSLFSDDETKQSSIQQKDPGDEQQEPQLQSQKSDKQHFLWMRRRRTSDPGDPRALLRKKIQVKQDSSAKGKPYQQHHQQAHSKLNGSRASVSILDPFAVLPASLVSTGEVSTGEAKEETADSSSLNVHAIGTDQVKQDHFADLTIPDYHLHLLTPESERNGASPTPFQRACSPLVPPQTAVSKPMLAATRTKPTLKITTNMQDLVFPPARQNREKEKQSKTRHQCDSSGGSSATVTSSQSRLRESTRLPRMLQRLIPVRNSSCRAPEVERARPINDTWNENPSRHSVIGLTGDGTAEEEDTLESEHRPRSRSMGRLECQPPELLVATSEAEMPLNTDEIDTWMKAVIVNEAETEAVVETQALDESASTHTTIITGSDLVDLENEWEINQQEKEISENPTPVPSLAPTEAKTSSRDQVEERAVESSESTTLVGRGEPTFRPMTPLRNSPNCAPSPETVMQDTPSIAEDEGVMMMGATAEVEEESDRVATLPLLQEPHRGREVVRKRFMTGTSLPKEKGGMTRKFGGGDDGVLAPMPLHRQKKDTPFNPKVKDQKKQAEVGAKTSHNGAILLQKSQIHPRSLLQLHQRQLGRPRHISPSSDEQDSEVERIRKEHKAALVQEAAQIAFQRSRAKEIVTSGPIPSPRSSWEKIRPQSGPNIGIAANSLAKSAQSQQVKNEGGSRGLYKEGLKSAGKNGREDQCGAEKSDAAQDNGPIQKIINGRAATSETRKLNLESISFVGPQDGSGGKMVNGRPAWSQMRQINLESVSFVVKKYPQHDGSGGYVQAEGKKDQDDTIEVALKNNKLEHEKDHTSSQKYGGNAALTTVIQAAMMVAALLFAFLQGWWRLASPGLNTKSDVWKRRRAGKGTWSDIGVFFAASMFCLVGLSVCCWASGRILGVAGGKGRGKGLGDKSGL